MVSIKSVLVGACFLTMMSVSANDVAAQTTLELLNDDKLLQEAVRDIAAMETEELRQFSDALVACFPMLDSQQRTRMGCVEKGDRYLIEYDQALGVHVIWRNFIAIYGSSRGMSNPQQVKFIDRSFVFNAKFTEAVMAAFRTRRELRRK